MLRFITVFGKALLICASLVFIGAASGVAYARTHGGRILSVESGSMAPFIKKGDAVLLDKHPARLAIGMVVTYQSFHSGEVTVTHRIVAIDRVRGTVQTKGDNLTTPDPTVPLSSVQGAVRYHIPHAGMVLDALRKPAGLAAIVYLPAVGIIISELQRLQRYYGGKGVGRYVLHGY